MDVFLALSGPPGASKVFGDLRELSGDLRRLPRREAEGEGMDALEGVGPQAVPSGRPSARSAGAKHWSGAEHHTLGKEKVGGRSEGMEGPPGAPRGPWGLLGWGLLGAVLPSKKPLKKNAEPF